MLLVCVFGGLGTMVRYIFDVSIRRWWHHVFPLATLLVNVIASFCAGMAAAGYVYHTVDQATSLMFVAGFLGGMSTFSAAVSEMVSLARNRRWWLAFSYALMSMVVPLVCAAAGWGLVAVTR